MVIVPDSDAQSTDSRNQVSFNPPGTVQIKVPMDTYQISSYQELAAIVNMGVLSMGIVQSAQEQSVPIADSPAVLS